MKRLPLFLACFVVLLSVSTAHAQFVLPGGGAGTLSISTLPEYPQPNSSVSLMLQSTYYDVGVSNIRWVANGTTVAEGIGLDSITLQTSALGTRLDISAILSGSSGSASTDIVIIPASVDLLWEADSYVPPFYRGRALPSSGSNVRVAALPHIPNASGTEISASELTYTWRKDNQILESFSGKGKSSALIESPTLFGTSAIVVDVTAVSGVGARAVLRVADVEPVLILYESHPLTGIHYHRALGTTSFVPQSEMSFAAVPYFAPAKSAYDPGLRYEWRINNTDIAADPTQPNAITINASASEGIAFIELALSHFTNYFFGSENAWAVTFNQKYGESSFGGFGPF